MQVRGKSFRIFLNEEEELDLQNRGTEYIKSVEMLNLALSNKRDNENFDRRRRCGTTRSSDIWSVGCLFYELLTGKFLFYDPDWIRFFTRVTSKDQELVNAQNKKELGNNQKLIDFLCSVLIRNSLHRPTIEHVLSKFKRLYSDIAGLDEVVLFDDKKRVNSICETIGEEEANKPSTAKDMMKDIEKNLQELQKQIMSSKPIENIDMKQYRKSYVLSPHSVSFFYSNPRAGVYLQPGVLLEQSRKAYFQRLHSCGEHRGHSEDGRPAAVSIPLDKLSNREQVYRCDKDSPKDI